MGPVLEAEPKKWTVSGDMVTGFSLQRAMIAKLHRERTSDRGTWGGWIQAPEGWAAWVAPLVPTVPGEAKPGPPDTGYGGLEFAQNKGSQSGETSSKWTVVLSDVKPPY